MLFTVILFGVVAVVIVWGASSGLRRMARDVASQRAALEPEGVELDSGPQMITTRYRDFHSAKLRRTRGITTVRGHVVLTRARFVIVPTGPFYGTFPRAELARFVVGLGDRGRLSISSNDPPDATGSIEILIPVADPDAWVKALTAAGARQRAA